MERTPLNEKAKNGKGEAKEEMEFGYAKRNLKVQLTHRFLQTRS